MTVPSLLMVETILFTMLTTLYPNKKEVSQNTFMFKTQQ